MDAPECCSTPKNARRMEFPLVSIRAKACRCSQATSCAGSRARYVLAVNDYEAKLLTDRTQLTLDQLAKKVRALVVTHGALGSQVYVDGTTLQIPIAPTDAPIDPTGCGDAYRAGLLVGIAEQLDWPTTGRLAATWARSRSSTPAGRTCGRSCIDCRAVQRRLWLPALVARVANRHAVNQIRATTICNTYTASNRTNGDKSKPPTGGRMR